VRLATPAIKRYYNYAGSSAQSQDYNTSPASTNSGIEQKRLPGGAGRRSHDKRTHFA
jgi:hypothetical protein